MTIIALAVRYRKIFKLIKQKTKWQSYLSYYKLSIYLQLSLQNSIQRLQRGIVSVPNVSVSEAPWAQISHMLYGWRVKKFPLHEKARSGRHALLPSLSSALPSTLHTPFSLALYPPYMRSDEAVYFLLSLDICTILYIYVLFKSVYVHKLIHSFSMLCK